MRMLMRFSSVSAACDCWVFKFLRRNVDGKTFYPFSSVGKKHLTCFQKETSVKFLRRCVDGVLLVNERKASKAIATVVPQFRSRVTMKAIALIVPHSRSGKKKNIKVAEHSFQEPMPNSP